MKTSYSIILGLAVFVFQTTFGQVIKDTLTLDAPLSGNQEHKAYKEIRLMPGFHYKANGNDTFSAQIVPYQMPSAIYIDGLDLICPKDGSPLYTVKSRDGRLEGGLPDELAVLWSLSGYINVSPLGLNCVVTPILGGESTLIVNLVYGNELISAQKKITAVKRVSSFDLTHDINSKNIKASINRDVLNEIEQCGITRFRWEINNSTTDTGPNGTTYTIPKLPAGSYILKCTVFTKCGDQLTRTTTVKVEPDCSGYSLCLFDIISSRGFNNTINLDARMMNCNIKFVKYEWTVRSGTQTNRYTGRAISLNCGSYSVECSATTECGNRISTTKYVSLDCPKISCIYPNPISDVLRIDLTQLENSSIQAQKLTYKVYLYDTFGNLKQTKVANVETVVEINVSEFVPGAYYVHIHNNVTNEVNIEKIIVER